MADGRQNSWVRRLASGAAAAIGVTVLATSAGGEPVSARTLIVPNLELDVLVEDAVPDPIRPLFYATTTGDSPTAPAQIVVVDRRTAQIVDAQAIGGQPGALGVADDGSALYVGNNTTGFLQKRALPDLTLEWEVSVERRVPGWIDVPEDIEVSPADPDLVVASFRTPGLSPSHAGVFAATEGRVLTDRTPPHTGPNRIDFTDDPTKLVGASGSLWYLDLDADGVEVTGGDQVDGGVGADLEFVGGIVVGSSGRVVEPGPPARLSAEFDEPLDRRLRGTMAVDDDARLVYSIESQAAGTWDNFVSVHDLDTGDRVDYFDLPDDELSVRDRLRFVGDGLILLVRDSETRLLVPSVIGGSYGEFTPLTPARIVDTRNGIGRTGGILRPGETFEFQVAGEGGVPGSGVIAAVLNVTAVNPSDAGYFTVFPSGIDQPTISSVNFPAGRTVPNLVTVRIGEGGRVSVFNANGNVHLVVDVAGFYADADGNPGARYQPVTPRRLTDTRIGIDGGHRGRIGPEGAFPVSVRSAAGVPSSAIAVVLNVTAVNATAPSFLTVHPNDVERPTASNLNFGPGGATANQVIVAVPDNGIVNVYNSDGHTDVIVDILGYYAVDDERLDGRFIPIDPFRFLDTRIESPFPASGVMTPGDLIFFDEIPDPESALVANLTVTRTQGGGYVTALPYPDDVPFTSSINYVAGQTVANHAIIPVDPSFAFLNQDGETHLIVDLFGYFT